MKCERMIPNIYEQSFDMRTICRLFDIEMELLEYYTNHILDCYSPEHCPRNLLPELAEHIGFDYQELKTVMYNRVVLKNFIKNMIRYRGSATGISNAAAIDIRYRQTYPDTYYRYQNQAPYTVVEEPDPDAGKQIPMEFHESIDRQTTWIDVDQEAAIIYLFIIASDYFPKITPNMGNEEKQTNFEERMRRLLDLAYLQEYVRPVGMYLLPMVAQKVNPYTDLTVKAVVIPEKERTLDNGVTGTPNSSFVHQYDRMLFAKVEHPDDELSVEPWRRTLYHSQLSGKLKHEYYTKPVYHIEGKFLYYDHDELLTIYQEIQQNVPGMGGMKIGDSLYNPNIYRGDQNYNYGPNIGDEYEPETLQESGKAKTTSWPLSDGFLPDHEPGAGYTDHVGFPNERTYQDVGAHGEGLTLPSQTSPDSEYPIYHDAQRYTGPDSEKGTYLVDAYEGTHRRPTLETHGDGDDGTNKNLLINLFTVDGEDESRWTGANDVMIAGKEPVDRNPVPYDAETNGEPTGDDAYWTTKNSEGEDDPDLYIP